MNTSCGEEWMELPQVSPYSSMTIELDKYDHVSSFVDVTLIPLDHHMDVFVFKID